MTTYNIIRPASRQWHHGLFILIISYHWHGHLVVDQLAVGHSWVVQADRHWVLAVPALQSYGAFARGFGVWRESLARLPRQRRRAPYHPDTPAAVLPKAPRKVRLLQMEKCVMAWRFEPDLDHSCLMARRRRDFNDGPLGCPGARPGLQFASWDHDLHRECPSRHHLGRARPDGEMTRCARRSMRAGLFIRNEAVLPRPGFVQAHLDLASYQPRSNISVIGVARCPYPPVNGASAICSGYHEAQRAARIDASCGVFDHDASLQQRVVCVTGSLPGRQPRPGRGNAIAPGRPLPSVSIATRLSR